jgi:hypothetical protein
MSANEQAAQATGVERLTSQPVYVYGWKAADYLGQHVQDVPAWIRRHGRLEDWRLAVTASPEAWQAVGALPLLAADRPRVVSDVERAVLAVVYDVLAREGRRLAEVDGDEVLLRVAAARRDRHRRIIEAVLAAPRETLMRKRSLSRDVGPADALEVPGLGSVEIPWSDPELAELLAGTRAACEETNRQQEAATAEAQRQADQRKAQAEERLREWALEHGSELVKARLEDGYQWTGLARREYAASVVEQVRCGLADAPEFKGEAEDREAPTLAEIQALRNVRAAIKAAGLAVEANICWLVPEGEGEQAVEPHSEIELTITCPDGGERIAWLLPPAEAGEQE